MTTTGERVRLAIGDAAPDVAVPTEGASIQLGDSWRATDRGLMLLFLRHFGCMFCRQQVTRFRDRYDEIRSLGFDLLAIGNGTPARAASFRLEFELPFRVLGDRARFAYGAYGVELAPVTDFFKPALYVAGVRALAAGHLPGRPQGDTAQLPGAFVIDRAGIVRFARYAEHAGDFATADEMVTWIEDWNASHP